MLISKVFEIILTEPDFDKIWHATFSNSAERKNRQVKDQLSMHLSSIPRNNLAGLLVNSNCIHAIFMLVTVWRLFLFSIADFFLIAKIWTACGLEWTHTICWILHEKICSIFYNWTYMHVPNMSLDAPGSKVHFHGRKSEIFSQKVIWLKLHMSYIS